MSTMLSEAITMINQLLAPVIPTGVTGIEFLSVFLIVYAIIFMISNQIDLFKKNRMAQLILSLIIAYFTASSAFSVLFITKLFPNIGLVTVILISFLAVIAIIPQEKRHFTMGPLLGLLGIALVAYFTWSAMAGSLNLEGINLPNLSRSDLYGLIFISIFALLIMIIFFTGGKGGKDREMGKEVKKALRWLTGMD